MNGVCQQITIVLACFRRSALTSLILPSRREKGTIEVSRVSDRPNKLYLAGRYPGPIREAAWWLTCAASVLRYGRHEENARRKAADKKEIPLSPSIAFEMVRRIDASGLPMAKAHRSVWRTSH